MTDVRALLKARREEVKITHPLASYNKNGQLRCVACGILVKHGSAWEGHLGSKVHRTAVARLKDEEKAREAQSRQEKAEEELRIQVVQGKRKAEEDGSFDEEMEDEHVKRRRTEDIKSSPFPANFFSDPSRAIPFTGAAKETEDEDVTAPTMEPRVAARTMDLEYERFQRELRLDGPDERETYERATVFAEPELVVERLTEGFTMQEPEEMKLNMTQILNEEDLRRKKEQDERELIMDRLLDEERAQEEADMRVTAMKLRLEALKKKREANKTTKAKVTS